MYSYWENKYNKKEYLDFLKEISNDHIIWRERAVERIGTEIKGSRIKQDGTPYTIEDFIAWIDEWSKNHKKNLLEEFGTADINEIYYDKITDSFVVKII